MTKIEELKAAWEAMTCAELIEEEIEILEKEEN